MLNEVVRRCRRCSFAPDVEMEERFSVEMELSTFTEVQLLSRRRRRLDYTRCSGIITLRSVTRHSHANGVAIPGS